MSDTSSGITIDFSKNESIREYTEKFVDHNNFEPKPQISKNEQTTKKSSCRFAAFVTIVTLIILDFSTVIVIYRNSSNIESLKSELKQQETRYPVIHSLDTEKEQENIRPTGKFLIETTSQEGEGSAEIYDFSQENSVESEYDKIPGTLLAPINLWSDGGNDKISPLDLCKNAKPDSLLRSRMNTFYTLYTPVHESENPDINSIHIANHQKFKMIKSRSSQELEPDGRLDLKNRKTVIIIHGFYSSSYGRATLIEHLFKESKDHNLIAVDWSHLAQSERKIRKKRYIEINGMVKNGATMKGFQKAFKNRHAVAEELYHLLNFITTHADRQNKVKPEDIHLIGHSLGAHISGEAAYYYQRSGKKIGRITGLDASSICFEQTDDTAMQKQLDKSDAMFVDVWHTNANLERTGVGLARPIGHVDFWINGGKTQPICKHDAEFDYEIGALDKYSQHLSNSRYSPCSHIIANQYFLDSITRCHGKTNKGFTANPVRADQLFKYIKSSNTYYDETKFPENMLLENVQKNSGSSESLFSSLFSSKDSQNNKYFMGFWADKSEFDGQPYIELSNKNLARDDLNYSQLENLIFSQDIEFSGSGSGDFTIEKDENQHIDEWTKFWRESQNYIVYTKRTTRNPNKYRMPEKLPWDGYCE